MNDETQRITLDLPKDLYKKLKIACINDNCTMKEVVVYLVRKWLNKIQENKNYH